MYYTWEDLFWIFLFYSLIGWIAGVIANAFRRKEFVNTGFLNLPLCPVYGVIEVFYCIFLPELKGRFFFLFLGSSVLAFFVIVMTGLILEKIFNAKWWDYSKSRFQFQGYVRFSHLFLFGLSGVVSVKFVNPFISSLLHMVPDKILLIAGFITGMIVIFDSICCIAAVFKLKQSLQTKRFVGYARQISKNLGNALTGYVEKRIEKAYPNVKEAAVTGGASGCSQPSAIFAEGCCFDNLVGLFFIGAFLGDITETIFCRITAGRWMSRSSVVYGPFSIVWGLGCVFLTLFLYKYKDKNDRYIFLYGTILGGAYEYICSIFTELVFGTVFWDYSKIPFNLGGRINLLFCFFWGIAAVVWLKILYPVFSGWIERIPVKCGKLLIKISVVFMVWNILLSAAALYRYNDRLVHPTPANRLEQRLDERFPDERMHRIYPNAKRGR